MIIRYRVAGILLFLLTILYVDSVWGQSDLSKVKCVCIDAGHGGKDPGAVGLKSKEKDIVLSIALKVGRQLKETFPDMKVVYTRDKDVFIDLDKRGKIANDNKADLFVSIHINSNDSKNPKGLETYVLGLHRSKENLAVAMKENSVIRYEKDYSVKYAGFDPTKPESYIIFSLLQNLHLEKSLQLASFVQDEMVQATKRIDRGVRQAGYLVLKDAAMPAILVEAGFISNAEEERYLCTQAAQNKIAGSIFQAIKHYKTNLEKKGHLLSQQKAAAEEEKEDKVQSALVGDEGVIYAIQIASALSKEKNKSRLCSGETVCELACDGRYRYYVTPSNRLEAVKRNLPEIKQKVRDCFIIAIYQGKVISVAEAQKLERK